LGELGLGLAIEHVVTRSVRDCAALLDVVSGPMPGDPYQAPAPARPFREEVGMAPGKLRVACHDHYVDTGGTTRRAHPDCVAAVAETALLLEGLGHYVDNARLPALESPEFTSKFGAVWSTAVLVSLEEMELVIGRKLTADDVEPLTWALRNMATSITAASYVQSWMWLHRQARAIAELWRTCDLLLTPTMGEPPPRLGEFSQNPAAPMAPFFRAANLVVFTPIFNVTGQPAISLPLHRNGDGLPIGVQLVAAYGREDLLLRVASQLEQVRPFAHPHV
jgi:amidase